MNTPGGRSDDDCAAAGPAASASSAPRTAMRAVMSFLRDGLEALQAGFEIAADHLVHVDHCVHDLGEIRAGTIDRPGDSRAVSLGDGGELGGVVRLERTDEVELDQHLRRPGL